MNSAIKEILEQQSPRICKCTCHRKDIKILHSGPCCHLTYKQYINEDGTIDYKLLKEIKNEYLERSN